MCEQEAISSHRNLLGEPAFAGRALSRFCSPSLRAALRQLGRSLGRSVTIPFAGERGLLLRAAPTRHTGSNRGEIIWAKKWTPEQIAAGRSHEEDSRRAYYEARYRRQGGLLRRFWRRLKSLFGQLIQNGPARTLVHGSAC